MEDNDIIKELEDDVKLSVQSRQSASGTGPGLLFALAATQGLVAPWWSKRRDQDLRERWRENDFVSGAFYNIGARLGSVPFRIEPRDPSVKAHWKQAEAFEITMYERSDFGGGWVTLLSKWLLDLWTQDNGAFFEILGDGQPDGPIRGPAAGIAHLDSWRCQRTGDPEFPVVYTNSDGKRYKLHRTRVTINAQVPSPAEEMLGVGFCWFSRCLGIAQGLTDILVYNQEKLGSRPLRGIIYGNGYDAGILAEAVQIASEQASNLGLSRFAKYPVVMNEIPGTAANLGILDLASLPDGFDYETSVQIGMFAISMAGGFPPRWLWPATTVGATKADAMYQHVAGAASGTGQTLSMLKLALGGSDEGKAHMVGRFLPPHLRLVFDFQDDELDKNAAEIKETRSKRHEVDLNTGAVDVRTVREQMLSDGDLTDAQFEALELGSGRTTEGIDVQTLVGVHPLLEGLDRDELDPVLAQERMRALERDVIEGSSSEAKRQARIALAALTRAMEEAKKPEPPTPPAAPSQPAAEEVPGPQVQGEELEQGAGGEVAKTVARNFADGSVEFGDFADFVLATALEQVIERDDGDRRLLPQSG